MNITDTYIHPIKYRIVVKSSVWIIITLKNKIGQKAQMDEINEQLQYNAEKPFPFICIDSRIGSRTIISSINIYSICTFYLTYQLIRECVRGYFAMNHNNIICVIIYTPSLFFVICGTLQHSTYQFKLFSFQQNIRSIP